MIRLILYSTTAVEVTDSGDNFLKCIRIATLAYVRSGSFTPNTSFGLALLARPGFLVIDCWLPQTASERKAAHKIIVVLEAKEEPIQLAKWDLETENTCTFSSMIMAGGWLGISSLDF